MSGPSVLDGVAYALILLGALLSLTAGIGLLRFPDVLTRMHAATKPQALGLLLVVAGAFIRLSGTSVMWMLLLVGAGQLLTAPLTAHMVSRIAYRRRHARQDLLLVNEIGFAGFGHPTDEDEPPGDAPADATPDSRAEDDEEELQSRVGRGGSEG